jgi:hypothetical protein
MLKAKILYTFIYQKDYQDIKFFAFIEKRIVATDGILPPDVIVIKEISASDYVKYKASLNI